MILSIKLVRFLTRLGMIIIVFMFLEYIVFRTFYSMIGGVTITAILITIRCKNCRTPIYDHRIAPYVKGVDLGVLEKCPVCGEKMLQR